MLISNQNDLLISSLPHYAVLWACWVFLSFSYSGAQRMPLQNLLKLIVLPTLQFFMFI